MDLYATRLLLSNSLNVLIEFWQFIFLDISLSLPVPVDQAWVLNQKMILKSFFWVIFAFGCHLRIKIYNTKRFWFDVFLRIMNATEHSKFLEMKFWVYCWILQSDLFDWRVSTYQLNNGMDESSPVNHLSAIDIKLYGKNLPEVSLASCLQNAGKFAFPVFTLPFSMLNSFSCAFCTS